MTDKNTKPKNTKPKHTKHGWRYKTVNSIIERVQDILNSEKVSFVEELVVLNWLNAELIYNLAKISATDCIEDMKKIQPDEPVKPDAERMYQ